MFVPGSRTLAFQLWPVRALQTRAIATQGADFRDLTHCYKYCGYLGTGGECGGKRSSRDWLEHPDYSLIISRDYSDSNGRPELGSDSVIETLLTPWIMMR